jgi:hypothetical protein
VKKCLVFFVAVFLSSIILSCSNNSYSVNTSKEQLSPVNTEASVPCQCQTAAILAWNKLSQSTKDLTLYSTALYDVNKKVGLCCKDWVRKVVLNASGLTIPSTVVAPNSGYDYTWKQDNSWVCGNIVGRSTAIQYVNFMDIIQMQLLLKNGTYGPHTTIVVSTDAKGMNWMDSNWDPVNHPDSVCVHYITYASFNSMVGTRYNIYHID